MGRLLLDASCLISLAKVGGLPVIQEAPTTAATTTTVVEESVDASHPETNVLDQALATDAIEVHETSGGEVSATIGPGEASLIQLHSSGDVLVFDDQPAGAYARAQGWPVTGTIGLLVRSVEDGWVAKVEGHRILEDLARTDFHLSVDLYQHARDRIEDA